MPLEELLQAIEKIASRVQKDAVLLQQNEAQTRYSLINPLLQALGWDIEDPEQVRLEYMYADYTLFHQGKSFIKVEAKHLNADLTSALSQSIGYCIQDGTPYFATTDGRRWEIYQTHKPVPLAQKLVTSFDVSGDPVEVARKALILWRTPTGGVPVNIPRALLTGTRGTPTTAPSLVTVTPPRNTLANLQASPSEHEKPPAKLRFPDGSETNLHFWKDLCIEIVRWLISSGKLGIQQCPIQTKGKRYLVHSKPVHSNGDKFVNPKQVGNLWVETHYNARDICNNSRYILSHVGEDPNQFEVIP